MRLNTTLASLVVVALIAPSYCLARSDLDSRVDRLENIIANEYNNNLLNQLEAMQQEVRELRGKLEEQQNSVQNLNQKQEKLFLNLDSRLNNMDPNQKPAQADPVESAPPAAVLPTEAEPVAVPPVNAQQQVPPVELEVSGTNEKTLFDTASNLMRNKKFAESIIEFKDLLWQFPEGTYASDSYYWLGEIYRMQWHSNKKDTTLLSQAKEAFSTVINKYQGQEREGDALLKLALLEMDQEHLAVAKDILNQVVTKFPNSARARIAESNIARIDKARIDN